MIGSTRSVAVWACPGPVDLRNGYDGLSALVVGKLKRDPLSGDCFLFTNRSRTRAKVLLWEGVETDHRFIKLLNQFASLAEIEKTPFSIDGNGKGHDIKRFCFWKGEGCPLA